MALEAAALVYGVRGVQRAQPERIAAVGGLVLGATTLGMIVGLSYWLGTMSFPPPS